MTFHSILFLRSEDRPPPEAREAPPFFTDLNLDQLINAITAGKQAYDLAPIFYAPLRDIDAIHYRQEVMQELEDETLMAAIHAFAEAMSQGMLVLQKSSDHESGLKTNIDQKEARSSSASVYVRPFSSVSTAECGIKRRSCIKIKFGATVERLAQQEFRRAPDLREVDESFLA